jgi:hypothetical protein
MSIGKKKSVENAKKKQRKEMAKKKVTLVAGHQCI